MAMARAASMEGWPDWVMPRTMFFAFEPDEEGQKQNQDDLEAFDWQQACQPSRQPGYLRAVLQVKVALLQGMWQAAMPCFSK